MNQAVRILITSIIVLSTAVSVWGRKWTDDTGKFSVQAEFKGVEGGTREEGGKVVLRKEDGTVLRVLLTRLSKKDREYINLQLDKSTRAFRKLLPIVSKKALADSIRDVFQQSKTGETTAKRLILEEDAVNELSKKFDGKGIILRFPIKNVDPRERPYVNTAGKTVAANPDRYALYLASPDFPSSIVTSKYPHTFGYMSRLYFKLSREEVLTIDENSVVVVSGKLRLGYKRRVGDSPRVMSFGSPVTGKSIDIYLDKATTQIE